MATKTRAKFDIKTTIPSGATRPLYAGVGVTDLAVERVREIAADVQKRFAGVQQDVQNSVSDLRREPRVLREQATTVVSARVDALSKEAKARRAAVEARVAELQSEALAYPTKVQALVNENVAAAGDAYGDLVKRGETLVGRIRRQKSTQDTKSAAKTTTAKAKTTKTQGTKAAKTTAKSAKSSAAKKASTPKSSAKATGTAAKKTASSAAKATTDAAAKVGD